MAKVRDRDTARRSDTGSVWSSTRSQTAWSTHTLTNTRTRIVGDQTGFLAEAVIAVVRAARAVRSFLVRALGRMASVLTPVGWTALLITPLIFAVGYGWGIFEFVVIGWALLVLLLITSLYLIGRPRIVISLALPHSRVVVGESAVGEVKVNNPIRHPVLGTTVEVPVAEGLVELVLPGLLGGGSQTHEFGLPSARRGVISVGPVRAVRADPIGLVRRELVWAKVMEFFVHPRTIVSPA